MLNISPNEYAPFYRTYIEKATGTDIVQTLEQQLSRFLKGVKKTSREQAEFRYSPEKWSVKQVLQHISDAERVFSYRALCIARGETVSLPPFDENNYAANSLADERELETIIAEYTAVRNATIALFRSFGETQLLTIGTANNSAVSVRAIGAIIIGHELHHLEVLNSRYGLEF